MGTIKGQNFGLMKRDGHLSGVFERCEVIRVKPHVEPALGDVSYNHVDVQLIDRPRDSQNRPVERHDVPVAQWLHGKWQGTIWTPRKGDLVIVAWLNDDVCFVLCTIPADEQEPVCRSQADDQQQEYVRKLSPWEMPKVNEDGNFVVFPPPKNPDCFKWWPKTRDSILVFDCKNGHNHPSCNKCAPCNRLDDILSRNYFKNFSSISDTCLDEKWRFEFHHNCGSEQIFDQDGTIQIQNKTSCSTCGGTGCTGTCATCGGTKLVQDELCPTCLGTGQEPCSTCSSSCGESKGHEHFYPEGTIDIHAGDPQPHKEFNALADESDGVRLAVVHRDDSSVTFSVEAKDFVTGAYIRIMKNGDINIYSPGTCTIKADTKIVLDHDVEITGDLTVKEDELVEGTCSGPNNVQ